jgi:hypothetical protein
MKGIAKGLLIEGIGEVDHKLQTTKNEYIILRIPTYYVPGANQRFFSPQAYFQTEHGKRSSSTQNEQGIKVTTHTGHGIKIKYNQRNNLPILYLTIIGPNNLESETNANETINVVDD